MPQPTTKPRTTKNATVTVKGEEASTSGLHSRTTKGNDHGRSTEKSYGSGQLSAYFQNKLSKNHRHSSTKKFGNMTQTLKDLKSMIYGGTGTLNEKTDSQKGVGIIQNSVRHSGVMKSVNALKSSFLDGAAAAKKPNGLGQVSRGRARNDTEDLQAKYASTVLNASVRRDLNVSKNYSINSRINNPRPLNNLAKNLAAVGATKTE